MKINVLLCAFIFLVSALSCFAGDIVTMPTANQLKAGQIDVANYYIGLDMPSAAPQFVRVQTLYVGLTNKLEVDLHRYELDKSGDSTIINATWDLMRENSVLPDLVVGGRNIGSTTVGGDPASDKQSWFLAAAKTLNLPVSGAPKFPIIRLHAGIGTEDNTLLGESRHKGIFGGVQMLVTPEIGLVALDDSQDVITGLTYMPKNTGLTLKGGGFGDHWWVGLSWAK